MPSLFIYLVSFVGPFLRLNHGPLMIAHEGLEQMALEGPVPPWIILLKEIDKLVLPPDDDLQFISLLNGSNLFFPPPHSTKETTAPVVQY